MNGDTPILGFTHYPNPGAVTFHADGQVVFEGATYFQLSPQGMDLINRIVRALPEQDQHIVAREFVAVFGQMKAQTDAIAN